MMNKSELIFHLKTFRDLQISNIALYIKDTTLNKVHIFVYKPADIEDLVERINSKYSDDSKCSDKEILAVKASESLDELNAFYNTLVL